MDDRCAQCLGQQSTDERLQRCDTPGVDEAQEEGHSASAILDSRSSVVLIVLSYSRTTLTHAPHGYDVLSKTHTEVRPDLWTSTQHPGPTVRQRRTTYFLGVRRLLAIVAPTKLRESAMGSTSRIRCLYGVVMNACASCSTICGR